MSTAEAEVLGTYVEDLWPELKYRPHRAQQAMHAATQRHRVNVAGRRCGKSIGGGHEIMPMAIEAYVNSTEMQELGIRHEVWIVGPNYTDSEKEFRVFYNDCKRLEMPFDKPGTYYSKQDMSVSLWGGRFVVHAKSGAHPESLVGEGLHYAVMAESAKMKSSVWHRFVRPMLMDFGGGSLWNTTPEGKNWFYHDIWMGLVKAGDHEWWGQRAPSWVNRYVFRQPTSAQAVRKLKDMVERGFTDKPLLYTMLEGKVDPEIISMCVDLTAAAFGQEVECNFTDMVGRVFKYWDEDLHVKDLRYNPDWPTYIATDYGYTHPNVALFIQVGPWNEHHVVGEYYRTHRTDEEFALDVLEDPRLEPLARAAVGLYPDPEDPGASETLSRRWRVPVLGGTGGPLKLRLAAIEKALRPRNAHLPWGHPERQPQLLVDRSCVYLRKEMDAYAWPEKRRIGATTDQPKDEDNHAPEALGRFYAGHGYTGSAPIISEATFGQPKKRSRTNYDEPPVPRYR